MSSARSYRKSDPGAPPGFYEVEAAGLRWLAAAGGAAVVGVRQVGPGYLVLDRLTSAPPTRAAAEAFGAALAGTHAAGAAAFGQGPETWTGDGFIGSQTMTLTPEPAWGRFFAEQRLLPYARAARDRGTLSPGALAAVERVAARLSGGEFDDGRPPARIHGDLWSGNLVFTAVGAVLIDPAAHGGHGLTDLAMLHLFGAPHLAILTAAYAEAADLEASWTERIGLHQLHPLLVHAVTHGPAYGRRAGEVARAYA